MYICIYTYIHSDWQKQLLVIQQVIRQIQKVIKIIFQFMLTRMTETYA